MKRAVSIQNECYLELLLHNMLKIAHSAETWQSLSPNSDHKLKLSSLYTKIAQVRQKWKSTFEQSIEMWINYIFLRVQAVSKEAMVGGQGQGGSTTDGYGELEVFIEEAEISVLKGIKNVEKLYMVPEFKPRSQSKQNHSKTKSHSVFDKMLQKSRSSSFGSVRGFKSSIFTPAKTNTSTGFKKNFTVLQQNYSKINSTVVKQYKTKPKFQPFLTTTATATAVSFLPQNTASSFIGNPSVSKQMTQSLQNFLTSKQKKQQQEIVEKVSSKFQQKLKNIQSDLNNKLQTIIENLVKTKVEESKLVVQQKSTTKIGTDSKQRIKRNSANKRITANPITQDQNDIENMSISISGSDHQVRQKVQIMEKGLEQFVMFSKKVKLPINEIFIRNFVNTYVGICQEKCVVPNLERFQLKKWDFKPINEAQTKNQIKQCFLKLKKLLGMDGLNGKAQKIKTYIDVCIRCCYSLVLRQENQIKQETGTELDRILIHLA